MEKTYYKLLEDVETAMMSAKPEIEDAISTRMAIIKEVEKVFLNYGSINK